MELSYIANGIEHWDQKSSEAWQEKSDIYISLLAVAEVQLAPVSVSSPYSESYAEPPAFTEVQMSGSTRSTTCLGQ